MVVDLSTAKHVTRAQLVDVARALGLDPDDVSSITIRADGIIAEVREDGEVMMRGWPLL